MPDRCLEIRLRHERRRLAIRSGHLVDDVFVEVHAVGHARQRVELQAKFVLRGRDFVVMLFRVEADLAHDFQHLSAHVLQRIDRRHREVAALRAGTMAQIAAS